MTTLVAPSKIGSILATLQARGLLDHVATWRTDGDNMRGTFKNLIPVARLLLDREHWQLQEIRSPFHADLGPDRFEFRTWGRPSFQIVVNPTTREFFADRDSANPEQDVAGALEHGAVDVELA